MTEAEFERELAAEREKRIQLLRATRGVLARALNDYQRKLGKKNARLHEIVGGVRMVSDQLRMEFRALEKPTETPVPATGEAAAAPDPLATIKLFRQAG